MKSASVLGVDKLYSDSILFFAVWKVSFFLVLDPREVERLFHHGLVVVLIATDH